MSLKNLFLGGVVFAIGMNASVLANASEAVVSPATIKEINQQIAKEGAQWKAEETWVSKLSHDELKRMLGSNSMPKSTLNYSRGLSKSPVALDWRNEKGINWLGNVLNQGNCGSCVAFATVGTLEAQVSIAAGLPWLHPTFSADQLFACGGGGCDMGWQPASAASFLKRNGIVDQACAPDTMGSTGTDVSCSQTTSCADSGNRIYKIAGIATPSSGFGGQSVEKVKEALTHGPVVTTLTVYTDFLTYAGGIYKHVSGKAEGGHAVSIVGYDNAARFWVIRNSWGKTWGENGFARVSWDDASGVASNTWQFQLPAKTEYLTVASPAENDYVSGIYQAKIGTNSTANLNIDIRQAGSSRVLTTLACTHNGSDSCVSTLETSQLVDGRYEMVARTGNSNVFSQVRSFYVVNQAPQNLTIRFTGADVDLNQPVKGRIEFNIDTTTSSVPFHSLTLTVRQNGRSLAQKITDLVLSKMKLGFRTNTLPNGQYELYFHGELPAGGKLIQVDSNIAKLTFQN